MFNKILIANRGEIAVRVIRTCREMGIKTVAIYSDADAQSLHIHFADEKINTPAVRGYLDQDFIIQAAQRTGAEAIHPGYGFLSENPVFANRCKEAGIVFIGPKAEAIELMGDKSRARDTMASAGVPLTPGTDGVISDPQKALQIARRIGYPVLVKAVAGGGGRGMRLAREENELQSAIESARSEANSSFGNSEVYLEKYLEGCRHVEMQILADNYGNVVYLGERDCSIQRRNQKLIEESPSPAVDPELRKHMGQIAVTATKAVEYCGAGTLEFLMDKDHNFYFMEMNTRIQVEHPVTELNCGIDLVREQIRIAAGEPLGYEQEDISFNGWAMECRINAEDPVSFIPSPGNISFYRPPGGFGVRLDSALYPGYTVSPFYDSLIAKLIVHGKTRDEVLSRMDCALQEFEISGVKTTIPFHKKVLAHPDFRRGDFATSFIQEKMLPIVAQQALEGLSGDSVVALNNDDYEIDPGITPMEIAVISAAISAYGIAENPFYKIKRIQVSGRIYSPWRMAALCVSMNSF